MQRKKQAGTSFSNEQKLQGIELVEKPTLSFEVYKDEGVSGTLLDQSDRQSLNQPLEDIYNGKIHSVYVYDQSRLEASRSKICTK
jgi:hypothetical protein